LESDVLTKDGLKMNLFNYSSFKTELNRSSRSLVVTWKDSLHHEHFNSEMLFELESLLSWLITRVEINSVLFKAETSIFSEGIKPHCLHQQNAHQVEKWQLKLQKLIYSMMQLPQTIIVDLGTKASNIALEFSLGADIRLGHRDGEFAFNHARLGLTPACGGLSLLPFFVAPAYSRAWLSSGSTISKEALLSSGFIHQLYDESSKDFHIDHLLNEVNQQAPIQRIQSKMGLFEAWRELKENQMTRERKISKASLVSEDWKQNPKDESGFMSAKSISYAVKLSLVKSEGWAEGDDQGPSH
jgi:enoyl-CoA hydratase/carnithine racemase